MSRPVIIQLIQCIGSLTFIGLCVIFRLNGNEGVASALYGASLFFLIGLPLCYIIWDRFFKKGKHERKK